VPPIRTVEFEKLRRYLQVTRENRATNETLWDEVDVT
jgi:hypothetical protein